MLIGVISDTHGLLRPKAVRALRGSQLILHAGDVGNPEILDELRRIAPVVAVRGNIDRDSWAERLPDFEVVEAGGLQIYMLHNLDLLDLEPAAAGFSAVVFGHSHRPGQKRRKGVLYLNPGSAGPRRFHLPVSIGRLKIADGKIRGQIVRLSY